MRNIKADVLLAALDVAPDGHFAEVGCMRQEEIVPEDGASSFYIAQEAKDRNCIFSTFDVDKKAVAICNRFLLSKGLKDHAVLGDGEKALRAAGTMSFLHLDGHYDPKLTLEQFRAVKLAPGAQVVVDDAFPTFDPTGKPHGFDYGKATYLIAYFDTNDINYRLIPTFSNAVYQNYSMVFCTPHGKASGELSFKQ